MVPEGNAQVVPDGVPMPRPMSTAAFTFPFVNVSTADVRSAVTVPPDCPTVKGWEKGRETPFTGAAISPG